MCMAPPARAPACVQQHAPRQPCIADAHTHILHPHHTHNARACARARAHACAHARAHAYARARARAQVVADARLRSLALQASSPTALDGPTGGGGPATPSAQHQHPQAQPLWGGGSSGSAWQQQHGPLPPVGPLPGPAAAPRLRVSLAASGLELALRHRQRGGGLPGPSSGTAEAAAALSAAAISEEEGKGGGDGDGAAAAALSLQCGGVDLGLAFAKDRCAAAVLDFGIWISDITRSGRVFVVWGVWCGAGASALLAACAGLSLATDSPGGTPAATHICTCCGLR